MCSLYGTVYNEPLISKDETNGEIIECSYLLLCADGEYSEMIPINSYGRVAQFVSQNIKSGMRVAVTGHLKSRKTKTNGYKLMVIAQKNEFDDGRNNEVDSILPLG